MRGYVILVLVLIFGVFITGCTQSSVPSSNPSSVQSGSSAIPQTPSPPSGQTVQVTIREKAFNPSILTISTGTTVIWTNYDTVIHRVVHLPGPGEDELFHSDRLDPGQSFSYTFTKPGRYEYADPQYAGGRTSSVIVT